MTILNEFGKPYEIENTATTLREPETWLIDWIRGGKGTASGVAVNEESAMKCAAVYACVRNIAEDVAKLPLILYKRLARGKERDTRNPLYSILHDSPNPEMTSFNFRRTVTMYAALCGNGYAEIVRNGAGVVEALWPLEKNRVRPDRAEDGRLVYWVREPDGGKEEMLEWYDMLHIPSLGVGQVGFDSLRLASESIGNAIAADEHAGAFFGNHGMYSYFLSHPELLSDTAMKHLQDSFSPEEGSRGAYRVKILEEGMKVEKLTIDPRLSQLIESRQHGIEEICRHFRMPPHKVQHLLRTTFSNVEAQNIDYVVDTLMPWLVCWEQEIARKLIPKSRQGYDENDIFAEHLVNGLLRGDMNARSAFYREMRNIGVYSTNDILEMENENPSTEEGADELFIQGAMVPLSIAVKGPVKEQQAEQAQRPMQEDGGEEDDGEDSEDEAVTDACTYCIELLAKEFDKLLQLEQDRVARAAKKPDGFDDWLNAFYDSHAAHVGMSISPMMAMTCRSLWSAAGNRTAMPPSLAAAANAQAQDAAQRHCAESKVQVKTPHGWDNMRGRVQAAREVASLRKLVEDFSGDMQ